MLCPKCGVQLDENSTICPQCGAALCEGGNAPQGKQNVSGGADAQQSPPPSPNPGAQYGPYTAQGPYAGYGGSQPNGYYYPGYGYGPQPGAPGYQHNQYGPGYQQYQNPSGYHPGAYGPGYQNPPGPGYYPPNPQPPYQGVPNPPYGKAFKSAYIAGLLAILLGTLGIHNFYLGEIGKGVAQLLLTLFGAALCGLGPLAAFIWAIVEAVQLFSGNICYDGDGYPLKQSF